MWMAKSASEGKSGGQVKVGGAAAPAAIVVVVSINRPGRAAPPSPPPPPPPTDFTCFRCKAAAGSFLSELHTPSHHSFLNYSISASLLERVNCPGASGQDYVHVFPELPPVSLWTLQSWLGSMADVYATLHTNYGSYWMRSMGQHEARLDPLLLRFPPRKT
ncbi:hypothetical protein ANCDUO_20396 [Ancylostoma duodenale]|uniref:Uncharacterized protein n=1 Tax=Ancylostoma duodenale TaxID=51022 RepID=A0A0C2FS97_9BILA|nr:hypothetical protein ANCDUO_20396 [Ancylostoma duodenale]